MSELLIASASPWLVSVLLLLVIFITVIYIPKLLRFFLKMPFYAKVVLLAAVVLGGLIRIYWTPNQDRILFDEDRYLAYAVTFAKFGQFRNTNLATPSKLIDGDPDLVARVTVPVLNGWVLKIFGYDIKNLYLGAKIFGTIQIILIFAAVYLLFKDIKAALFSSLILAFLPTPVYWSVSTGLDSYFVFFSFITFIASCLYARKPNVINALFLVSGIVLLLFVRLEAFLFLFVVSSILLVIRKSEGLPLISKRDIVILAPALLLIGFRAIVSLSVLGQPWCCGDATPLEAFSPSYFIKNTLPNLQSLFNMKEFPFIITILAIFSLFGRKDLKVYPVALWSFLYFFVYSFYFAGIFFTYTFSGSYGRYFLMSIPSLIILASLSLSVVIEKFKKISIYGKIGIMLLMFLCLATLVPTIKNYKSLISVSPYDFIVDAGPRSIQNHLDKIILPNTRQDSIIIHPMTARVLLSGRTAVYFGSFLYDKRVRGYVIEQLKQGVPIYIFQYRVCEITPDKCKDVTPLVKFVPVELEQNPTGMDFAKVELK